MLELSCFTALCNKATSLCFQSLGKLHEKIYIHIYLLRLSLKKHSLTFIIILIQPHILPVRLKISKVLPHEIFALCLFIETNVLCGDINKKNKLKVANENRLYFSTYYFHSQLIIAIINVLNLLLSTNYFYHQDPFPGFPTARKILERQGNMEETFFMMFLFQIKGFEQ